MFYPLRAIAVAFATVALVVTGQPAPVAAVAATPQVRLTVLAPDASSGPVHVVLQRRGGGGWVDVASSWHGLATGSGDVTVNLPRAWAARSWLRWTVRDPQTTAMIQAGPAFLAPRAGVTHTRTLRRAAGVSTTGAQPGALPPAPLQPVQKYPGLGQRVN
jgi:hypothetical protein